MRCRFVVVVGAAVLCLVAGGVAAKCGLPGWSLLDRRVHVEGGSPEFEDAVRAEWSDTGLLEDYGDNTWDLYAHSSGYIQLEPLGDL